MKTTLFVLFLVFNCFILSAQGVFSTSANLALEKVIQDYPNKFENIKGGLVGQKIGGSDYESIVQIPGALSCRIQYGNATPESVCWKAEILKSNNFTEASSRYKQLFDQLNNSLIRVETEKPFILNANFQPPQVAKAFQTISFSMLPYTAGLKKIKVDLSLEKQAQYWVIFLIIHDGPMVDESSIVSQN